MGADEGEGVVGVDLDFDLGKAAADAEAASAQEETVVRVRAAGGDGELAQDGDVDVGVGAGDVFPVREIEPFGFEGVAQFEQRVGAAHFLHGEHVGFEGADALPDFGFRLGGLGGAGLGGFGEIAFHVVGGHAEGFRPGEPDAEQQREREDGGTGEAGLQIHGRGNKQPAVQVKRAIELGTLCVGSKTFCKMCVRCYVSDMFKPSENGSARLRRPR